MKTWRVSLQNASPLPGVVRADDARGALHLVLEYLRRRGEHQVAALTPPADDEGGTR